MEIELRECTLLDTQAILNMRNTASARRFSRNPEEIALEEHAVWFKKRILTSNFEPFWVLETGNRVIGFVRFDLIKDQKAKFAVSILIEDEQRGRGLGALALTQAILKLKASYGPSELEAVIHKENLNSIKLFSRMGFIQDGVLEEFLRFRLVLDSI